MLLDFYFKKERRIWNERDQIYIKVKTYLVQGYLLTLENIIGNYYKKKKKRCRDPIWEVGKYKPRMIGIINFLRE